MKRVGWLILLLVLVAVAALGVWFGGFFDESDEDTERPPESYYVQVTEGDTRYDAGKAVRAPDQPGWPERLGAEHFGVTLSDLVVAARRSERIGRPEERGGVLTLAPFVLAAVPWDVNGVESFQPIPVIEMVVKQLRVNKILAFASPIALTFPGGAPMEGMSAEMREHDTWIGIPVPEGTDLPEALFAVPFPGGQVVTAEGDYVTLEPGAPWDDLVAAAASLGKVPGSPRVFRFSGWNSLDQRIRLERMLPIVDPPPEAPDAQAPAADPEA